MKRKNKLITAALSMILAVFSVNISATPVSANGKLHVTGLQLMNECGFPVQLRGVSTHGLQWNTVCYQNLALLDFAAYTMNADVFRIAMYVEQNGYMTNPTYWTSYVDTLVDQIGSRGMYAIIDWHVLYVLNQATGDPNVDMASAEIFWQHEAMQHKGKPYVIYELCNEPSPGTVTWDMIKTYANDIIPKIRAIDPDSVIICGTPNWSQLGSAVVASPLSQYSNLMYTFHFYAGSHTTDMLTNYINQLPIFVTEWGPSDSSGNGGDNYTNATSFINIMGGANTAGVTISWAEWALVDNGATSSELTSGTCAASSIGLSNLTTAGNYVYTNINNPDKSFICGTYTITPTITPYAGTPTATYTITPTSTQLPWDMIYDGDTAGYKLSDGVAVPNAWLNASATPADSITEALPGNPGNSIHLSYVTPGWWEGHSWSPNTPKTIGINNNIEFDILAASGNVKQLRLILDRNQNQFAVINATSSWTTVRVPLSTLYPVIPASIAEIDFVNNYNQNYSVLVDNIRLVAVPTFTMTVTKTVTQTATITQTHTVSPTITLTLTYSSTPTITQTHTISPTWSVSPTFTMTSTPTSTPLPNSKFVQLSQCLSYPNPTTGNKVTFSYTVTGLTEKLTINVYTFGERKIYSVAREKVTQGPHTEVWIPAMKLANGLYYWTIEGTNGSRPSSRHVEAFFVQRQIPTP